MKLKMLVTVFTFVFLSVSAFAQDTGKIGGWEFLQIGVWYGMGPDQHTAMANGVRVGLPVSGGKAAVNGAEIAFGGACSDNVNGVQFAPFATMSKTLYGVALSCVNMADSVYGAQIGVVNVAKDKAVQFGVVNIIEDSVIPVLPVVNVKF